MNLIEFLKSKELIYKTIIDLSNIKNITYEEKITKKGHKIYIWYGELNNKKIILSGKSQYRIILDLYCKKCGKILKKQMLLSHMLFPKTKNTMHFRGHTLCKKCSGKINAINGQLKVRQTCLKKYGVEYTGQRPWHREQMKKTCIEKYGQDYMKMFAQKAKKTYFKKHGVDHNGKIPAIRDQMIKKWKETVNSKSKEEMIEWQNKKLESYNKEGSPGIFGLKTKGEIDSKISSKFFELLKDHINYNIIRQKNILNYIVDFFIENLCCIEFYGDYWHANPQIFNENDNIIFKGYNSKNVGLIWKKDKERNEKIIQKTKLPLIIVWEKCFRQNMEKCILDVIELINLIMENKNGHGQCYVID